MKFTENRPIARAALALIVAGTLVIGGGNALIDQKKAVQAAFSAPSESISAELKEMADNAVVMNSIVANAKGAESEKTDAVSAAIDALNRAETIPDRYDAAQALNAALDALLATNPCVTLKQLAIRGSDLTRAGIPGGKAVGECLRYLLEQVMEDTLPNDQGALLRAAAQWAENGMPQGGNEGGFQS